MGINRRSTVTRKQLAAALGCDPRTIAKWQEDGLPVAVRGRGGRSSRYDAAAARAWLEARQQAMKHSGIADVAVERARKERAQAILAEQTYESRARQLLPVADVERAWNAEVQAVRAAILATYTTAADRLHRIAVLDGVDGVEAELKLMAHTLLRELADSERALPAAGEGQGHAA